jgi:hypothetical protein
MAKDVERPWTVYKQKNGAQDRIMEPGWAGQLGRDELERLQQALATDPDLARVWGWRPSMRRRAAAAVERVAANGDPENIAHNRKLVREFSRKPKEDTEDDSPKVKESLPPAQPRPGRPRIESWESELLRMASAGMGCKAIARVLQSEGVAISHATVANRLRELKGQLRLIS